jgi:4-hydroxy-tetrahydrodipicolinate synthase
MFEGVATAIITPFTENDSVDYTSLEKIVSHQISSGIDALVVLGTTGEAPTINKEERTKIIEKVVESSKRRVPIIIGTGSNNTKDAVEKAKIAEECGADGLLIVTPYYNKSTKDGLVAHYKYISERTDLPIILYNVPSRTGVNIEPDTVCRIAETCTNVVGIKEASGNLSQINELILTVREGFKVYSGNDDQTLPLIALGANGVISVVSNILPQEIKRMVDLAIAGDFDTARIFHKKYLKITNLMFTEVNPIPIKYAASRMGLCRNELRLPLTRISAQNALKVENEMNRLGVLA